MKHSLASCCHSERRMRRHAGPRRCNSLCVFASLTLNGKLCWPAHNAAARENVTSREILAPETWTESAALERGWLPMTHPHAGSGCHWKVCVCIYRNFLFREYDIHSFLPCYECHFPFEPSWRWWKWLKAECYGHYLPNTPLGLISGLGFLSQLWQMKTCG